MVEEIAHPTVGRIVYYYTIEGARPLAAVVADVYPPYGVVLGVFNRDGNVGGTNGKINHASEVDTKAGPYWDWMPYQKGQAAKTEQLQTALEKSRERFLNSYKLDKSLAQQQGDRDQQQLKDAQKDKRTSWDKNYDADFHSERSKTERSTPSPEDGKR